MPLHKRAVGRRVSDLVSGLTARGLENQIPVVATPLHPIEKHDKVDVAGSQRDRGPPEMPILDVDAPDSVSISRPFLLRAEPQ
jgi:hypothetical protein